MKQISTIVLVCLLACLGCESIGNPKPVWEDIKFKELKAAKHSSQADKTILTLLQFNFYIISLPSDNFVAVNDIWTNLSKKAIHFTGGGLFTENGFAAGSGQSSQWPSIAEKLRAAQSKNRRTIDLIIPDKGTDYVSLLLKTNAEKNIFHKAKDDQVGGVTLGPGEAMFRLTAATITDMRGVCRLAVEPAFKSADEVVFSEVSFTATMSPGDFILLGPARYFENDMTLSGIFFSSPGRPAMQLYLIICTGVNN
jgi:hypothetical protein